MLSTTGIVVAVILMAVMVAINFLGVRQLAAANSTITWWKIAVPLLTILVLALSHWDTSNLTAGERLQPRGLQGRARGGVDRRHHLQLPRLRAGRPAGR